MTPYSIILADPPWQYKVWSKAGMGRSAEHHYPTMTKADIQRLDVASVAANDAVLFLWVTWPCLQEGIELISQWGFTYKTCGFLWAKRNKVARFSWFWGMGYWTRANTEPCLLATRGNPKRISKSVHQLIEAPFTRHSAKPLSTHQRIVELRGDVPRLEMFCRDPQPGWDCFGNDVAGSISIPLKDGTIYTPEYRGETNQATLFEREAA